MDYQQKIRMAETERDDFLDARSDIDALAYTMAAFHVDIMLDASETAEDLDTAEIVACTPPVDEMTAPTDCIERISRYLATTGERYDEASVDERLRMIQAFMTTTFAEKIRDFVGIVCHHQRRTIFDLRLEIARDKRAAEAAENAAEDVAEDVAALEQSDADESVDTDAAESAAPAAG